MQKDRFPLHLMISGIASVASGVASNVYDDYRVGIAIWVFSLAVSFLIEKFFPTPQTVIYPSDVKDMVMEPSPLQKKSVKKTFRLPPILVVDTSPIPEVSDTLIALRLDGRTTIPDVSQTSTP